MVMTKIEAEIDIPEGFEFDRVDTKTKDGDYDFDEKKWGCHEITFKYPKIILRKKKPKTRWFRAFRCKKHGGIIIDSYSTTKECDKIHLDHSIPENYAGFLNWITDWIEYPIE